MKIGFVINDLSGGGAEKALLLFVRHILDETDHEVVLATLEEGKQAYPIPDSCHRFVLRSGVLNRGPGRIASLPIQAFELARLFRGHGVDVSLSYLMRSNAANVLSRRMGNPGKIVLTEHITADPKKTTTDRIRKQIISSIYPKADRIIAVSEGVRTGLGKFGIDPTMVDIAYNPIDMSSAERARAGQNQVPVITTIGRLNDQKDHPTLLRAFARIRESRPAVLRILGVGPREERMKALASSLGISDDVVFLGWSDNPYSVLAASDLFVLSSAYEGFGIVIAEALACGLPVVSTDCPSGPAEILGNGRWGDLVPVGNPQALADAICEVLDNPEKNRRMREMAVERARDFDVPVTSERMLSLLAGIAAS